VDGGVEVINAGVAGDTVAQGLARLDQDVTAHSPDYVLVMFGSEDVLQGVEAKGFQKDLEKIVKRIAASTTIPVLITPVPFSERMTAECDVDELRRRQARLAEFAKVVCGVARKQSLRVVDLHRFFLENRLAYEHLFKGWQPDGVAQSAMASFVAGELARPLGIRKFPTVQLCDHHKIYSNPTETDRKHNGFTFMTLFEGEFYVTFRQAFGHGSSPTSVGRVVVLRSADGITWHEEAVVEPTPGAEGFGPCAIFVAGGHLLVYAVAIERKAPALPASCMTYASERLAPGKWSAPFECAPGLLWRLTKWRGQYMNAACDLPGEHEGRVVLYSSPDGRRWQVASVICGRENYNNETDLWAEGDKLMAFARHDPPEGGHQMQVFTFIESENRWEMASSGRIVQAPCVFKAGERLFVAGRTTAYPEDQFDILGREFSKVGQNKPDGDRAAAEKYHHGLRTGIFVMDGTRARQVAELLSAGDSSYCGAVQYGCDHLISDYSMHEYYRPVKDGTSWITPCDIYVSRIRFGKE
jgi:lysophospholipase L1-like esterase